MSTPRWHAFFRNVHVPVPTSSWSILILLDHSQVPNLTSDSVSKACHLSQSKGLMWIDRALTGGCFQAASCQRNCVVLWQFPLSTPLESLSASQWPASILSLLLPQEVAWAIHHACYQVWRMETEQVDELPGTCSLQQWCSILTLCWERSTPCFQGNDTHNFCRGQSWESLVNTC